MIANVTTWQESQFLGAFDRDHQKWNCFTVSLTNSRGTNQFFFKLEVNKFVNVLTAVPWIVLLCPLLLTKNFCNFSSATFENCTSGCN